MSTVAPGEDGAISGLSEQLEKLKSEKSFLFKTTEPEPKLNLGGSTKGAIKNAQSGGIKNAVHEFYKN